MECIICDKKFEKNILFENEQFTIMLAVEPSVNGHIQIFPKEHFTIIEQVPDETISAMMAAANKLSMVLFEVMKVHGTNIIINNGVPAGQKIPHVSIDILPRRTDDNLKLDWTLKQAAPEALESIQRIIGEGLNGPVNEPVVEEKVPEKIIIDKIQESRSEENKPKEKKANYHHKLFERIP